jgi:tetratricopeptide (TPR) repeat protein
LAEPVRIETERGPGFARVIFIWSQPVGFEAKAAEGWLSVRFGRTIDADFALLEKLAPLAGEPILAEDRLSLRLPLAAGVTGLGYAANGKVMVDLFAKGGGDHRSQPLPTAAEPSPTEATAPPQASPEDGFQPAAEEAARLPVVRARTGEHRGFTRVVFDWSEPIGHEVSRDGTLVRVRFDRKARLEAPRLGGKRPPYLLDARVEANDEGSSMTLTVAPDSAVRVFRHGSRVVLDVLAPGEEHKVSPVPNSRVFPAVAPAEPQETPAPAVDAKPDPSNDAPPVTPSIATGVTPPPVVAPVAPTKPPVESPRAGGVAAAAGETMPPPVTDPQTGPLTPDAGRDIGARLPERIGSALFTREGWLWVIFKPPSEEHAARFKAKVAANQRAEPIPHPEATVLRVAAGAEALAAIRSAALFPKPSVAGDEDPDTIQPVVRTDAMLGTVLFLPAPNPGAPVAVADPDIGDTIVVVPFAVGTVHLAGPRNYPQFRLLPSAQGIAIQPFIDTLHIRTMPDGVLLSTDGGLKLSTEDPSEKRSETSHPDKGPKMLLDLARWFDPRTLSLVERRREMEEAVIRAKNASERELARQNLAEFFLAHHYAAEALGVLRLMVEDRPELERNPRFRLMRGASRLLLGRLDEAEADLEHGSLDELLEGELWLAATRAAAHAAVTGNGNLGAWVDVTAEYPEPVRVPVRRLLTEIAVRNNHTGEATRLLDLLRGDSHNPLDGAWVAFYDGHLRRIAGDGKGAIEQWRVAADGTSRLVRARALLDSVNLEAAENTIDPAQAIETLERSRFVWRGDLIEFRLLHRLGQLYLENNQFQEGLATLRQAVRTFPHLADASEALADMAAGFERLFLTDAIETVTPMTAITLHADHRDLDPGGEKGRRIGRVLAAKMAEIDLLDPAAEILAGLAASASSPAERAELGADAARLRLIAGQPEGALEQLGRSSAADMPAALARERRLLEIRALAAVGRDKDALDRLADDFSSDAELIRVNIFRRQQDWNQVSQALGRLVAAEVEDARTFLSAEQAEKVVTLAAAMTLARDGEGISRLRRDFGSSLAGTAVRDAFRLVTAETERSLLDMPAVRDAIDEASGFERDLGRLSSPAPESTGAGR